jgi:TonB family protein
VTRRQLVLGVLVGGLALCGSAAGEDRVVPQDLTKSIEAFDTTCRQGVAISCVLKGASLLERNASGNDVAEGLRILERACEQKDQRACAMLGVAYAEGGALTRDMPKAAHLLEGACGPGLGAACHALAVLLDSGDGVARDPERARKLLAEACHWGQTPACEGACDQGDGNLCLAWAQNLSAAERPEPARIDQAYERACNAAAAQGCLQLAGRVKDDARAVALRERACTLGDAYGCAAAAQAYYVGRGVAVDLAAAVRLYAEGCERGRGVACAVLGGVYARGDLGAEQTDKARAYFVKACGTDAECQEAVGKGDIPKAWGGSLGALRPDRETAAGGQVRVGGAIKEPKKIRNVPPTYPPDARRLGVQGAVVLECVISPSGDVTDVRVMRSVPLLDAAAVEAVRQWRYTPTLLEGKAVPVIMTVTVNFTIS